MEYPELRPLVGQYEVLAKIREGGMGAIYRVRHRHLEQVRVVKVMKPRAEGSEELRRRFLREAQTATRLSHPHIVAFFDYLVSEDGRAYMVMESVAGLNLSEVIRTNGPLPVPLALAVADQALSALAYLHRKGVIHRDVAPDNIMLTRDEDGEPFVKLIDLGIARLAQTEEELTAAGVFVGKLRYCSPEQLLNRSSSRAIDGRSDLYSFGVVLYEALTAICPFKGESISEIINAHISGTPLPFETTDSEGRVGVALRAAVMKALEPDVLARFQTAEDFRSALLALPERGAAAASRPATAQYLRKALTDAGQGTYGEAPTVSTPGLIPAPTSKETSTAEEKTVNQPSPVRPTVLETPFLPDSPGPIDGSSPTASRERGASSVPTPSEATELFRRPSATEPSRDRRRKILWLALGSTVAALAAGLGIWILLPRERPTAQSLSTPAPGITPIPPLPEARRPEPTGIEERVTPPPPDVRPSPSPRAQKVTPPGAGLRSTAADAPPPLARMEFCPLIGRTAYEQGVIREKPAGWNAEDLPTAVRAARPDAGRIAVEFAVQPEHPVAEAPFTVVARLINGGDAGLSLAHVEESAVRESGGFRELPLPAGAEDLEVGGALEIFRFQGVLSGRSSFSKEIRVTDRWHDTWRNQIRLVPCPEK